MPVKETNKPNPVKDLFLLFAIPIGIAIVAALAIYVPQALANPKYDFIYSACDGYSCSDSYTADLSGKIVQSDAGKQYIDDRTTLHYYSAKDDATRIISLEEAKLYQLNTSSKSPDGYSLVWLEDASGFLFWGDGSSGWYLKNGAIKKYAELTNKSSYYDRDIKFIGWINK
jgi:hypothetical protein